MKEQKRFETEQEILNAIDKAKHKAIELEAQACEFDRLMKDAARSAAELEQKEGEPQSATFWRDQMQEYKLNAAKLRVTVNGINNNKLKMLSEKLAEMKTEPMNFLAGDRSVQG